MEKYEHKIIPLIHNNDISVLVAPLGSGKTTVLPKMFTRYNAKVYCIQPNEAAVTNVFNYLRDDEHKIGYELEDSADLNPDNKIIYCTCDIVVNKLMNKNFDFCSIIMIDDAHYYSIDYELLIYLWLHFYKINPIPKLFMSLSTDDIPYIPVELSGAKYIIPDKKYREKIYHSRNFKFNEKEQLIDDMCETIIRLDKERRVNKFSTWLVYVWDMKYAKKILKILEKQSFDITIFNSKGLIYNELNKRLIVLIIDVNTSITLNHVDGVIDCMLEVRKFKKLTGGNKYIFRNISKSTAMQRDGRTNRTKKGFSYRMCTEEFYNMLSKYTPCEMDSVDLTDMFIKLYRNKINPYDILSDKLDKLKLKYYSELIETYNLDTNVFYSKTRELDTLNNIFLMLWIKDYKELKPFEGVVIACILDLKQSLCYYPTKNKKTYFNEKFKHLGSNILEIYCRIYFKFLEEKDPKNDYRREIKDYCRKYSYNYNEFKKLVDKIDRLSVVIDSENTGDNVNISILVDNAITIMKTVYDINICVKNRMNYISKYKTVYSLNVYEHYSPQKPSDTIIMLDSIITTDDENRNMGKKMITYYVNL